MNFVNNWIILSAFIALSSSIETRKYKSRCWLGYLSIVCGLRHACAQTYVFSISFDISQVHKNAFFFRFFFSFTHKTNLPYWPSVFAVGWNILRAFTFFIFFFPFCACKYFDFNSLQTTDAIVVFVLFHFLPAALTFFFLLFERKIKNGEKRKK